METISCCACEIKTKMSVMTSEVALRLFGCALELRELRKLGLLNNGECGVSS